MKVELTDSQLLSVRYIKVDAGVRYWEDTVVNGEKAKELVLRRYQAPWKSKQNQQVVSIVTITDGNPLLTSIRETL